ncbi:hypothetical protein H0178_37695 [Cytobacillus firmus]|uniref:hypothetical protein n=1 Tax=Paenibacillus lautus TaxID=1401 RepID=UPI0038514A7F|nr:hypothetical protein [Cytobacillus firmus]
MLLKNIRQTGSWLCILWIVLALCSCRNGGERVEHIEAFIVEDMMITAEGLYVPSGYKKVNSITNHEDNQGATLSRVRAIEDYYDSEGKFMKTRVYDQSHKRWKNIPNEDSSSQEKELEKPLTIHIPDDHGWKPAQLTDQQKDEIKAHVIKHTQKW